ncbi:hypothetical protein PINS_up009866 [Pythium insidiosum]|nr:hypothetical protein PINS_up009866 [Pythium insidiosum]
MASLVTLCVNMNRLVELPDTITRLPQLRALHASRNELVALPRNIGDLAATLRDLRLDWNRITALPFSFRLLTRLETLCMERNPLKLPPLHYIARGVRATIAYMEKSLEEFVRKSRREVVEAVQQVLTFAMQLLDQRVNASANATEARDGAKNEDEDALDALLLSSFEPRVERMLAPSRESLPFFAVVWDRFLVELLPLLESRQSFRLLTRFTRDELDDALTHYEDFFGPASMTDSADFRRCACIDELAWTRHGVRKRRVCIPRQVPYRCHRAALLIRMTMMTTEEAKDQLASTYLRRRIERLVIKTKRKCVAFINSERGVEHFERLAVVLAKQLFQKRKRLKKIRVAFEKESRKFAAKKQKLELKIAALRNAKAARLAALQTKLETLRKKREDDATKMPQKRDEKKAQRLDDKIAAIERELEAANDSVEDQKVLEVELALEGIERLEADATAAMEKAKAKEMRDGIVFGDGNDALEEKEEEGEEEEEEEGDEGDEEEETDGEEEQEEEEEPEDDEESSAAASSRMTSESDGQQQSQERQPFFNIEMPDLVVADYRRAATSAIETTLGDDTQCNVEELVVMYQQHLRDAYVAERCALVEKKATYEFLQMRAVLRRWMGLGLRAVFEGWRDVAKANRADAEKVREKLERKQRIEAQNRALEEQLARLEARKWLQRVDMYTDAVYYEHSETHATSWTPPVYWDDEQAKMQAETTTSMATTRRPSLVPALRLPPI